MTIENKNPEERHSVFLSFYSLCPKMYINGRAIEMKERLYTEKTAIHTSLLAPEHNNRRAVVLLRSGGNQKKIRFIPKNL